MAALKVRIFRCNRDTPEWNLYIKGHGIVYFIRQFDYSCHKLCRFKRGRSMRASLNLCMFTLVSMLSVNTLAAEPVTEPHVMIYYQFSFGGGKPAQRGPVFG